MPYKKTESKNGKIQTIYIGQVRKNEQRRERRFKTRKEALAWESMMKNAAEETWQKETPTTSLGDWALQYLDYAKNKFSTTTYDEKRTVFKRLFQHMQPTCTFEQMTPAKALAYSQEQLKNRTGNAVNKDRKNLLAAWNWGTRYMDPKLPSENPFNIEKMPEQRSPRFIPQFEDFWKVYGVAEGQDKIMIMACLFLAARRNEIFNMKVEDIDFENDQVRLWTRKREGGHFEYDWLPMVPKLKNALKGWLENRPVDSKYVFVCVDQTAFTKEYYGQPFKKRQHLFERLCEKAQVRKFGFHSIRHLTASQLYNDGCYISEIQRILRHKSPATTVKYLQSLGVGRIRTVMDNFQIACEQGVSLDIVG